MSIYVCIETEYTSMVSKLDKEDIFCTFCLDWSRNVGLYKIEYDMWDLIWTSFIVSYFIESQDCRNSLYEMAQNIFKSCVVHIMCYSAED